MTDAIRPDNRIQRWKKWVGDHKLGIPKLAQMVISTIVGLLVVAAVAYVSKKSEEEVAAEAVAKLFADSTVENFKEKLGGQPQIERDLGALRELMWINAVYAVKAFTESGKNGVVAYTVTTRTPSFAPEIPLHGVGKLGEARFSAVNRSAHVRAERFPNGYWYYDEAIEASAYTNYETVVLGSGWSGLSAHSAGSLAAISTVVGTVESGHSQTAKFRAPPASEPRFLEARRQLTITTYGYLSDTLQLRELPGAFTLAPSRVDDNKFPAKK
ncbi:ETEC_3214 domain-containing protein [Micromonospora coxensis]|uniref:Uncharacterized protein n=1 Tax=Micromonospora coxensis TaxID=356852 RepID=A0A1C5JWJ8_9ACTN|nr:ETEC_3214 domain-containing protein [Micromonospora coxensis]SCG74945.1 hypothetical protein GA0070614_5567 [Micromonospora coxensis]